MVQDSPSRPQAPRSERETASAAVPRWKKKLLEAVKEQRRDRTFSETVEHAFDLMLFLYGLGEPPVSYKGQHPLNNGGHELHGSNVGESASASLPASTHENGAGS